MSSDLKLRMLNLLEYTPRGPQPPNKKSFLTSPMNLKTREFAMKSPVNKATYKIGMKLSGSSIVRDLVAKAVHDPSGTTQDLILKARKKNKELDSLSKS